MTNLNERRREVLSQIAWRAAAAGLRGTHGRNVTAAQLSTEPSEKAEIAANLQEKGASFVTLLRDGRLRGCIGTTVAHQPLGDDVARHAFAAAFEDPRFAPLQPGEWSSLSMEISVLAPPAELSVSGRADLLRQLRPGIDGLILRAGRRRATFLPSVWDSLPDPSEFVDALLAKAGLHADAWPQDLIVQTYTVEKWGSVAPDFSVD